MSLCPRSPLSPAEDVFAGTPDLSRQSEPEREAIARRIEERGDWFHNIDLRGVPTAPNHFLGDFPNVKWKHISQALPRDLEGASVLDLGCMPVFPYPGSPLYIQTFGAAPDDHAGERAHHHYTAAFRGRGYSDVQGQDPAAIEDLECTF